jgi:putative tryptophan/tyrosine transport system substrate-binding protein
MRRRIALLTLVLAPAACVWPLLLGGANAADSSEKLMHIGFVSPFSAATAFSQRYEPAFWKRLRELGWVEGRNLVIETRWAQGRIERFPALMSELVAHKVDLLFTYTTPAAIAAKKATSTIPIVDAIMGDPVGTGLATSLAKPGANLTGLSMANTEEMAGKWLELLQETIPRLSTVAVVANPDNAMSSLYANRLEATGPTRGLKMRVYQVRAPEELDRAFDQAGRNAQALIVVADPNLITQQKRVVALAAKHKLPDMHIERDFVDAGALISYAPDYVQMFTRAAEYVDKILRGAKPGDLPIEQPTKFELVVNLKRAATLGIKIPRPILLRADEVIK